METSLIWACPGNFWAKSNIVRQKCHNEGSKIYSCFVDFKKAFDSVPRDLLLSKLFNMGITGNFFNILRHIYTTDKACIKIGQSRSDFFNLDIGVRQGCILSPLLFNLFLSDLAKQFDKTPVWEYGNQLLFLGG